MGNAPPVERFRAPRTPGDQLLRPAAERYEGRPCKRCGSTTRYRNGGHCVACGKAAAHEDALWRRLNNRIERAISMYEAW